MIHYLLSYTSNSDYWEPGRCLPSTSHHEILTTLQMFQENIGSKLTNVSNQLDAIGNRMSSLEQRQTVLEDEIRSVPSSSSSICWQ